MGPAGPAGDATSVEELAGGPVRRRPAPGLVLMLVVVAVVVAVAVGLESARSPASHRAAAMPAVTAPAPTVPAVVAPARPVAKPEAGWVFLEHLGPCTFIDGSGRLRVAVGVTNLSNESLRFASAAALEAAPGLHLASVRVGRGQCAERASSSPVRLRPSDEVVVAMTFDVGPPCPRAGSVAARIGFDGPAGRLFAESSTLADLARLPVACVP